MRPASRDLTISEALSDPLIRAAMRADRVDARDLEELLADAARRLESGRARKAFELPATLRCFRRAPTPDLVRETCG